MCITHLISHTPCGHFTTSLPRSIAGHCKALDAALCYYHSQPDRPPLPGGMVMPSVCEGSTSRFWPVPWGCGRTEDEPCRFGWGGMHYPWAPGEAQRARRIWEWKSMPGIGSVSANVSSDLTGNTITSQASEPGTALVPPHSNPMPTSSINLSSNASGTTANLRPHEAQFWGWGWWIDPRTGGIAPPPVANATAALFVATATREKISLREGEPRLRMIWPGRCIIDGDVGGVYCG